MDCLNLIPLANGLKIDWFQNIIIITCCFVNQSIDQRIEYIKYQTKFVSKYLFQQVSEGRHCSKWCQVCGGRFILTTNKSNFRGGNAITANIVANLLILIQDNLKGTYIYLYSHFLDSVKHHTWYLSHAAHAVQVSKFSGWCQTSVATRLASLFTFQLLCNWASFVGFYLFYR